MPEPRYLGSGGKSSDTATWKQIPETTILRGFDKVLNSGKPRIEVDRSCRTDVLKTQNAIRDFAAWTRG